MGFDKEYPNRKDWRKKYYDEQYKVLKDKE